MLLLKVKWSRQYFHTFDQTYSIQREEEAGLKRAAIITIPGKNYNNYNPIYDFTICLLGLVTSEQVHTTTSKLRS